jgi:hypothetical protein
MALIVEDGTVVADADSYVTTAYADTYWSNRNEPKWAALTAPQKEAALREACLYLDQAYKWSGSKIEAEQPRMWPRAVWGSNLHYNVLDVDQMLPGILTVPQVVKMAQCELALEASNARLAATLERGGMVTSESVGSLSITYALGAPGYKKYPFVDMLIREVIEGKVLGGVSAEAVRG